MHTHLSSAITAAKMGGKNVYYCSKTNLYFVAISRPDLELVFTCSESLRQRTYHA